VQSPEFVPLLPVICFNLPLAIRNRALFRENSSISKNLRQSAKIAINRQKNPSIWRNSRQSKKITVNRRKFPSISENFRQSKKNDIN
jgi:hypothetical protein